MTIYINPELSVELAVATTKEQWFSIFEAAFPSRRVICSQSGVPFRNCAMTGAMSFVGGVITSLGDTSDTTVALAADLSVTKGLLRIESGGNYLYGTVGLSGSDFNLSANPTINNGLAFKTLAIPAPAGLPTEAQGDTTPPTVSIAVAATNITTAGGLLLTATAYDAIGVAKVEFYRDSIFLGTINAYPFTFTDNLTNTQNGAHTYTAKAFDAAGNNTLSSASEIVTVSISAPTGVLATMTVVNTNASPISSDFIPPMFGHPFKKGDIPTGYYPKFELADATNVPYTMFNQTTWTDGSLKFASFLIRVPTTVASSSTVNISVKNSVTAPATTSSRTTADLSSGATDLKVSVVGLDNLSGTWESSLNQGIFDNDDVLVFGDGAVGKVWRIRQQFMQSAANHGQLECYWYVAALQDASGGLYGIRYLGRVGQPWYNVDSPAKNFRSFSSFKLMNGASQVRDCWANHASAIPFSYASGNNITATAHTLETGYLVQANGTTVPAGLSKATSYFAKRVDANTLQFNTNSAAVTGGGNLTLSGSASAATLTAYPYLTQFGSLWTCGSTGKWDYVQAGGTVSADATIRIQHDKTYWKSSGVIPAYDLSVTPTAQSSYNYELNTMGPVQRQFGGTGERSDIGLIPTWYVKHILSQNAVDEQLTRVVGLAGGHLPIQLYNSTNKTLPAVNNSTYSGMPAHNSNFRWRGTGNSTGGFTNPTNTAVCMAGVDGLDMDHTPCFFYYPYVLTGEPQFLDMVLEMGNHAVQHRYSGTGTASATGMGFARNGTVNGTTYYGTTVGDSDSLREDAWSMRDLGVAAGLAPDAAVQCAAYKTYFNDMNAATFAKIVNFNANVAPAFWRTAGMIHFRQNGGSQILDNWMIGYWMMANAQVYKMTECADALTELNHVCKWFKTIRDNYGAWHIPCYEITGRTGSAINSPYVTSIDQLAFYVLRLTSVSSNATFTNNPITSNGYVVTNNDKVRWDDTNGTPPTGFTSYTNYYVVNASGNTFGLSATLDGSPITPTSSKTAYAFFSSSNPPSTNNIQGPSGSAGYLSNTLGACRIAAAAGATVDSELITDLAGRVTAEGITYSAEPKYKFSDTY